MVDVEQSMHSVFKDLDEEDIPTFQDHHSGPPAQDSNPTFLKLEDNDDENVFQTSANTSGYPEPTLIPGKEGGKVKTFYKCDKCHKSFPKRKRYYNHKVHRIVFEHFRGKDVIAKTK